MISGASVRSAFALMAASAALGACCDDATHARAPGGGRVGTVTALAANGSGGETGGETGEVTGSGATGDGGGATGAGGAGHGGADACGPFRPFDPDGDGDDDGPRHDDPSDPEILASCGEFCDEVGGACGSGLDREACIDACRLRACDACRGTLVPVIDCERVETVGDTCTCEDGVPRCPVAPSHCTDYLDATLQCAT